MAGSVKHECQATSCVSKLQVMGWKGFGLAIAESES
jgi:hypothetical protein